MDKIKNMWNKLDTKTKIAAAIVIVVVIVGILG
jgi:flagellar biosynthesis/type III secretory pathway M-ring protein FliF/YscJ